MSIFNKIKDILFNDEEIDEEIVEEKEEVKKEVKVEEPEEVLEPLKEEKRLDFGSDFEDTDDLPIVKEKVPEVEERDVFKANNTFNFPVDVDEDDFVPIEMPRKNRNALDFETKRVDIEKYVIKKTETVEVREVPFKASPIISPIYGVMDKNYKKEDIVVKKKVEVTKTQQKNIDLDLARKKAFGTLEDEIEITLDRPYEEFYKEEVTETPLESEEEKPIKSIDDLLIDSMAEEREESLQETFKLDEVIKEMKKSSKELESSNDDLFDLIDSMYESEDEDK